MTTVLEQLEAYGAPAELVEEARAKAAASNVFEIWPDNWESLQAFRCLATQWRVTGKMDRLVRTGLDYAAVLAWLRECVHKRKRSQIFNDIQLMEAAALEVFADQAEQSQQ